MEKERNIVERLVEHGEKLFNAPQKMVRFTQNEDANRLLNNLTEYPHAFVLASIMDRQIRAERAWLIPYLLKERLGDFSMESLIEQKLEDVRRLMSEPEPLHRFSETMAEFIFKAVHRIASAYGTNAALIWANKPSSATVVYRFLEFEGIGPKIASMDANILAREFKVEFSDYYSIDISADVHVKRVFGRLGLTPMDASPDQLIFRARGLHPEFPGIMDLPSWEIGRNWCRPKKSKCEECYMSDICQSAYKAT